MNTIRRFFDSAIGEPAAQSVAQLMATQGVKSEPGEYKSTPIDITETKVEPIVVPDPAPAVTANEGVPKTESAPPEVPKPIEEPVVTAEPQKAERSEPAPSWQEVLKSQQPDTVFKEMGFDDSMVALVKELKQFDPKVVGLVQAYKNGTHVDYLRELSTDYTKLSAEEVMRHQLRQEYPKASDKALEVLFKKEVVEKYNLDSVDEAEAEEGRLLLDAKADRYRDEFTQRQEKYLLPKAPEPVAAEPDKKEEADIKQFEVYKSQFINNQYTKDIFSNKQISIGEGDEKFNFPVKPEALSDILYNGQRWMERTSLITENPDGTKNFAPDVKRQMLIAAVAEYGEDFLNEYAKHFKSLGGKTVVETIDNARPVENNSSSPAQKAPDTVAEAMARQGRVNYGGYQ